MRLRSIEEDRRRTGCPPSPASGTVLVAIFVKRLLWQGLVGVEMATDRVGQTSSRTKKST